MFTCSLVLVGSFTFLLPKTVLANGGMPSPSEDELDIPPYYGDDMDGFLHQLCLEKKNVGVCQMVQSRLWGEERLVEAMEIAEIVCQKKPEECNQVYYLAELQGPRVEQQVLKKIGDFCEKEVRACEALSYIYDGRKDAANAVKYSKRYYDKMKTGFYGWLAYKYNVDKKLAFEDHLKNCRQDGSKCAFTLRYMPDHPQRNEIIQLTQKQCHTEKGKAFGATSCAIAGAFHFSKNQHQKAYEMWDADCKSNNTLSCLMLLGGTGYTDKQYDQAMRGFCFVANQNGTSHPSVRSQFCPGAISQSREVASAGLDILKREGLRIINVFLQEQK